MGERQAVIGGCIIRVDLGPWLGIILHESLQALRVHPLCDLGPDLFGGPVLDSDNGGFSNWATARIGQCLAAAVAHVSPGPAEVGLIHLNWTCKVAVRLVTPSFTDAV